jgi:plastocyanin
MRHRGRVGAVALTGIALIAAGGTALAAGGARSKARVVIAGGESFKPNQYLQIGFHFAPGTIVVKSGATITLTNETRDVHTLSIVKKSQLPRTLAQLERCQVCGELAKAHGVNPEAPPAGPPPVPLVNVGAAGFNVPGDSTVIGPKGHGSTVTFKVTARPGTVLNFMCAVHPWMQGRFLVK